MTKLPGTFYRPLTCMHLVGFHFKYLPLLGSQWVQDLGCKVDEGPHGEF